MSISLRRIIFVSHHINYRDYNYITDADTGKIKSEYIDELIQNLNVNKDDIHWDSLYDMEGLTIDEVKNAAKKYLSEPYLELNIIPK